MHLDTLEPKLDKLAKKVKPPMFRAKMSLKKDAKKKEKTSKFELFSTKASSRKFQNLKKRRDSRFVEKKTTQKQASRGRESTTRIGLSAASR